MPAKLVHHLKAHYSIDDIKALIVADLRGRGFPDVVSDDLGEDEHPEQVRPAGVFRPFEGFFVNKEITVKPPHNSRGPG